MRIIPRLTGCALEPGTRIRANGQFAAIVNFLDCPKDGVGIFQRVQIIYSRDGFPTRGRALSHAVARMREVACRPDILAEYRDWPVNSKGE